MIDALFAFNIQSSITVHKLAPTTTAFVTRATLTLYYITVSNTLKPGIHFKNIAKAKENSV